MMTPDYELAAIRATETLINYNVNSAPVIPLPILKSIPGVLVVSFAEMTEHTGIDRGELISMLCTETHDAVTYVKPVDDKLRYLVAYNQRLPFYMLQRSLARELGHIILGHDGSKPENVREEEASCFAKYLLFPRPLLKAVQDAGIPLTVENIGNMTGCYERCLRKLRKMPGIRIKPELNALLRVQFQTYIENYLDYQRILAPTDESPLADLGTYMDNYE